MNRRSRRSSLLLALAVTLSAALALSGASHAKPKPLPAVAGEFLIGFAAGVSPAEQQAVLKKVGASERRRFKKINSALARVRPEAVAAALAELRGDKRVRYAEPNFVFQVDAATNDPFYERLWGLENTGQPVAGIAGVSDADIDAPEAWSTTKGSTAVTVAVIDTGVDSGHPDLSSAIWVNAGENCAGCRADGRDNDGNGYVDDWRGWDFANADNDPADDHGHGTHVAGTIGAVGDNDIGVTGVAQRVRLMPLKFLTAAGSGTTADAVSAILYASQQGADVLNNSWGGDEYSQALADAIAVTDSRDQLFVAAAGNDSSDNDFAPAYPASFDFPNVISVAATDNTDELAWFSNVGRNSVDLAAPGLEIYSTWPGGGYLSLSGTSMAAPHVAGAAALAKAAFPSAGALGLKALLLDSVDPKPSLSDLTASGGRLNAAAAVGCAEAPKLWLEAPGPGFEGEVGTGLPVRVIATRCASPSGVTISASANGSPIALSARGDGLYTGTYTPTDSGPQTISATATAGGSSETRTISGNATGVYPITVGGAPVTITTTRARDENARLRFDGQTGQRVSVKLSAVTITSSYVSILRPDGSTLASKTYVGASGGFVDTRTLPTTGSYTIVVDPLLGYAGSMTVTLYDVPPDLAGPITPSGPGVPVSISTPGQKARLTFSGQTGQRISLKFTSVSIPSSYVSLLKPDGSALGSKTYAGTSGSFQDPRTLPATGTYTILVDPQGAAVGSMTVNAYDVPADPAASIVAGGAAATTTIGTPGQNARLTFEGRSDQRISIKLSSVTLSSSYVSILKPDGTAVGGNAYVSASGAFVDTRALPAAGAYTLLVDPQGAATGSMTVTLYDVPADTAGAITPSGPASTVTAETPGQNASLTFDGLAGQRISVKLSGVTISSSSVSILKPDGKALGNNAYVGPSGSFVDTRSLPDTGRYTIVVDPQGAATGSMTVALYDVPEDTSGTLAIGGSPLTAIMGTPGQNGRLTFDGKTGQRVTLKFTGVSISMSYVTIFRPDLTMLGARTAVTPTPRTITVDLPSDGTYAIVLDPQGAATGSMTLQLSSA
jgi:subtilisin family serine protease